MQRHPRVLVTGAVASVLVVAAMVTVTLRALRHVPSGESVCREFPSFTWDAEVGACVDREDLARWGTSAGSSRHAAYLAVQYAGAGEGWFVFSVDGFPCVGCYSVVLDRKVGKRSFEQTSVTLRDWKIVQRYVPPQSDQERCGATAGKFWCVELQRCMRKLESGCPVPARIIASGSNAFGIATEGLFDVVFDLAYPRRSLVLFPPDPAEVLMMVRQETGIDFQDVFQDVKVIDGVTSETVRGIQMRAEGDIAFFQERKIREVLAREGFMPDWTGYPWDAPSARSAVPLVEDRQLIATSYVAPTSYVPRFRSGTTVCTIDRSVHREVRTTSITVSCGRHGGE